MNPSPPRPLRHARRSLPKLLELLELNPPPAALPLIERMKQCRAGSRCKVMACPVCGRRAQKSEKRSIMKAIYARVGGNLNRAELSFITVKSDPTDGRGLSLVDEAQKFKKRIRYVQRWHLVITAWAGFLELGLFDTRLHLHAVVYHPDTSRDELRRVLKREFLGARAVSVQEFWAEQTMFTALQNVVGYSTKHLPKDDRQITNRAVLSRFLGHHIVNRQRLSSNYVSVRFKINMSTPYRWRGSILVSPTRYRLVDPEMEEYVLRGRGAWRRRTMGGGGQPVGRTIPPPFLQIPPH